MVPTVLEADFKSISAGHEFSLGILSDSRLLGWVSNLSGQIQIPEPFRQFAAVSAGTRHSVGLRKDGTVVVWESDSLRFEKNHDAQVAR